MYNITYTNLFISRLFFSKWILPWWNLLHVLQENAVLMPFRQIYFYFCSLPRSFQLTLWGFEYFRIPVLWVDSPLLLFCDVRCSDNPMLILDIVYLKTICGQTHVNLTSDYSIKQNISFWNLLLYDNKWKWKSFFHWFSISEFRKKMFIFCSITAFTNKLMVWPWVLSLVLFLPTFF